ncbi:MAG: hypothetical protein JXK05_05050 [Campylobacterales bacterium]|nr:hypothetical protein [Campylobacterales bacterium]
MKSWEKEHFLFAIVVLIAVLLAAKTVHFGGSGAINVSIMPQQGGIATLDTPKNHTETKTLRVPTIDFANKSVLEHPDVGVLGFSSNFFMELRTRMQVRQDGQYTFYVASDDGFRLHIDDRVICEHLGDRPFATSTCTAALQNGAHTLRVEYFQGGGPLGLKALYKHEGQASALLIGKNSDAAYFEEIQ